MLLEEAHRERVTEDSLGREARPDADVLDDSPDHAVVSFPFPCLLAQHRDDVLVRLVGEDADRDRRVHDLEEGVRDRLVDDLRALLVERDPAALEVDVATPEPRNGPAP
ncbi:MAG TPA: hypothetical protein VFX08_11055 [Gaiella sp.]|nr:hypothetical protein [Gaiella sp.]HEX5584201.1 hypothetical protein [Gaiella sp.]